MNKSSLVVAADSSSPLRQQHRTRRNKERGELPLCFSWKNHSVKISHEKFLHMNSRWCHLLPLYYTLLPLSVVFSSPALASSPFPYLQMYVSIESGTGYFIVAFFGIFARYLFYFYSFCVNSPLPTLFPPSSLPFFSRVLWNIFWFSFFYFYLFYFLYFSIFETKNL